MDSELTKPSSEELRKGFRLAHWSVLPEQNLLRSNEKEVRLEPKVMEVLLYLAAHQGNVVKREQLINDVWQTYVSDEVLSRAISLLRTGLEDDRKKPRFVQTVPKSGYRLIHEVAPINGISQPASTGTRTNLPPIQKWLLGGIAVATVIILLVVNPFNGSTSDNGFSNLSEWLNFLDTQNSGNGQATSIAVLPFDNLSEEPKDGFFSEGITDEITMSLSRVHNLKVVARRSSYSFKNSPEDVPTIGKLLSVDAVLEGSVRRQGDSLRINAQLSDAQDGFLLWSQSFDRPVGEAFNIQDELSKEVVVALQKANTESKIQPPETTTEQPDMQAYQLYLHGRFLWKLRGEQPLRKSIQLYQQAVALDPGFTRAKLALANSIVLLPFYSQESMDQQFNEALAVIAQIKGKNNWEKSEIEAIKAFIAWHRWQWIEAETHFRKAIELSPDSPNTYVWYSQHLSSVGRNADAVVAAERAKELDAVSPVVNDRLGMSYLWINDNIRAAEQFSIGLQLGFSNSINPGYIIFLLRQQRYHEFKSVMEAIHPNPSTRPDWLVENGHLVFLPENSEMALKLATHAEKEGKLITPLLQFGLWILIGGTDQAYEKFDQFAGTDKEKFLHTEFLFTRESTAFRQDTRFKKLTKSTGLQSYWGKFGKPDYQK